MPMVPAETRRSLATAIFIGIFSGLLVVCFHISIDFIAFVTVASTWKYAWVLRLLGPAIGALIASYLVRRTFPEAMGSGVNQTKAALYIRDGYVAPSSVVGKFLACSISLGSGNSLGPEDPALQMGAGVASALGRRVGLTRDQMRTIAPVGAASGIAAAFNTPITGVLFVLEEVIAAWSAVVVGSILLAAVSAVVVVRWFLGSQPLFHTPPFELRHPTELLPYAVIGILGGLLSGVFIKGIEALHEKVEQLPKRPRLLLPGIAGLAVGLIGIWLPQVLGPGYEAVDGALHGRFVWHMLLILGLAKIVATLLCFGAGTPGGMFAPTLFTGAMIGGGVAGLMRFYWPFPMSAVDSYVLAGMGTFFAGVFRAPMTSIFMVFELSASYVIILPVMISNTLAYFVSRALQPVPFFTMLARDEGVDLPSAEDYRNVSLLRVEDAMQPPVEGALPSGPTLYPDLPLDTAMRLLGTHPVLPVASRADPSAVIGIISLADIHRAYGIARSSETPAGVIQATRPP